jgi:hypothetical protein
MCVCCTACTCLRVCMYAFEHVCACALACARTCEVLWVCACACLTASNNDTALQATHGRRVPPHALNRRACGHCMCERRERPPQLVTACVRRALSARRAQASMIASVAPYDAPQPAQHKSGTINGAHLRLLLQKRFGTHLLSRDPHDSDRCAEATRRHPFDGLGLELPCVQRLSSQTGILARRVLP